MSRRYNPGLAITSVLALLALLMMPSASGTGTDGAPGTPSGNIAGGLFGIPAAAIADGAVLKVTLKDSPTSTIPDADWTAAGLTKGTAPRGQQVHGGKRNLARLVALPIGTDAVEPVDLTVTVPRGTVSLSAEHVHVSPVMIMRGQPIVVVSVDAAAIREEVGVFEDGVEVALVPIPNAHGAEGNRARTHRPETGFALPLSLSSEGDSGPAANRGTYLIISTDEYVDELSDLIDWKVQAGFDVHLSTTSEIGATRAEIRQFVQDAYDTWEDPPLYLLLVGDPEDVPTGDISHNVSDNVYATVDGDDFIPDLFVGRFSANNPQEVAVQVAKTVAYESRPDTTGGDNWFGRALVVAGNSGSSTPKATSRWIRDELIAIGYTSVDSCYYPPYWGEGKFIIPYFVDQGVSIVSYRGWARLTPEGWEPPCYTNDDIPLLANGWKLPVVFSIVCETGHFGRAEGDCFGEVWMKTGSPDEPRGAIGFIGTGEHHSHSRWNDRLSIDIFESFCHDGMREMGPLLAAAKVCLLEQFPTEIFMGAENEEESVEYYAYTYNLLGDPSLAIWSDMPRPLVVQHPEEIAAGANFIEIRVLEEDGITPVEAARASLSQDGSDGAQLIGFALTDENGLATISIKAVSDNPITMTVTGMNLYPAQAEIGIVTQERNITCTEAVCAGAGTLLPGVEVEVDVTVFNSGTLSLDSVTGTVQAPAGVEVVAGALSFGSIPGGASAVSQDPMCIVIAPGTENGAHLRFLLDISASGGDVATTEFWLATEAPEFCCVAVAGGEDDLFDPGEEAELVIRLHNDGVAAGEIESVLRPVVSGMLTMVDSAATFSEIPFESEGSNDGDRFRIQIDAAAAVGTVIPMELIAESAEGPLSVVHFNLVVGLVDFSAPTGPDAYGYFALDSADIEYPDQAPVYNWVECSGLFGGEGTKLAQILDNLRPAIVQLPFTFTYYGREYNRIRVSDNGWLAFDTAYWYDIRNWNMPDRWGCACQVAPFWDNLFPTDTTHVGNQDPDGIYWLYDEESHCFVVEWSRLRNWEDNTDDFQTFEVLLCDPDYYPTTTGDGEIIFQYKQIVNDDVRKMYSTVGIEDHTEEVGLLYTYANEYEPGAAPLTPGLAIKFTTERPVFQPIELGRFEAFWVFAGGAGGAVPGGSEGDGGSDAWVVGNGSQLREGILVRWEFTDERPLTAMELYRVEAEPAGAWGRAHKVHEGMLAPRSGSIFDAVADPSADSNAAILYRMIGVGPFGKKRTIGEVLCTGEPGGMPMLRLPEGNLVGGEVRILCGAGNGSMQALTVYDVSGRSIRDLLSGVVGRTGSGVITWDGRDDRGNSVPGGVYWVRLSTSAGQRTARLVVIR